MFPVSDEWSAAAARRVLSEKERRLATTSRSAAAASGRQATCVPVRRRAVSAAAASCLQAPLTSCLQAPLASCLQAPPSAPRTDQNFLGGAATNQNFLGFDGCTEAVKERCEKMPCHTSTFCGASHLLSQRSSASRTDVHAQPFRWRHVFTAHVSIACSRVSRPGGAGGEFHAA